MTPDEAERLGRSFAKSKGFAWVPGMLAVTPDGDHVRLITYGQYAWVAVPRTPPNAWDEGTREGVPFVQQIPKDSYPDLYDSATFALLYLQAIQHKTRDSAVTTQAFKLIAYSNIVDFINDFYAKGTSR